MAYFKKCLCGHLNVYEKQGMSLPFCEKCSRQIISLPEELYTADVGNTEEKEYSGFDLVSDDGQVFHLLKAKQIIGRNALCNEYLKNFPEVSREHFIVKPRSSGLGFTIKDISAYGSSLNGKKMTKNEPVIASNGAVIKLVNRAILTLKYGGDK